MLYLTSGILGNLKDCGTLGDRREREAADSTGNAASESKVQGS